MLAVLLGLVFPSQRGFEERLGRRLTALDVSQRRAASSLDTSLRRVHTDMHHLSGGLLDIIMSVQRLEDKLDRLAGGVSRLSSAGGSRGRRSPSRSHPSPRRRRATPRSVSIGSESESREPRGAGSRRPPKSQRGAASNPPEASSERGAGNGNAGTPAPDAGQAKLDAGVAAPNAVDGRSPRGRTPREGPADLPLQAAGRKAPGLDLDFAPDPSESMGRLAELSTKFGLMDKKLDRIAGAVGVKSGENEGDDEQDRKRLKEKLKAAIETDRRSKTHTVVSSGDAWLEYLFGICKPDQRNGKRGSRCLPVLRLDCIQAFLTVACCVQAYPPQIPFYEM
jgi:hypothetical protein